VVIAEALAVVILRPAPKWGEERDQLDKGSISPIGHKTKMRKGPSDRGAYQRENDSGGGSHRGEGGN